MAGNDADRGRRDRCRTSRRARRGGRHPRGGHGGRGRAAPGSWWSPAGRAWAPATSRQRRSTASRAGRSRAWVRPCALPAGGRHRWPICRARWGRRSAGPWSSPSRAAPRGASESLDAVMGLIPHILDLLAGDTAHDSDDADDPTVAMATTAPATDHDTPDHHAHDHDHPDHGTAAPDTHDHDAARPRPPGPRPWAGMRPRPRCRATAVGRDADGRVRIATGRDPAGVGSGTGLRRRAGGSPTTARPMAPMACESLRTRARPTTPRTSS